MEACPIATSAKDASGALPSAHPTANTATCTDDSSGCAASTYDIEDTTGRVEATTGAPDALSSTYSPVDVAIGCASSVNAMAAPNATHAHHWHGTSRLMARLSEEDLF